MSRADSIRCACPHCKRKVLGTAAHLGRRVHCPACKEAFVFSPEDAEQLVATAAPVAAADAAASRTTAEGPLVADRQALSLIPENLIRTHTILPVSVDEQVLTIATADPLAFDLQQKLEFLLGRAVRFRQYPAAAIQQAIERVYGVSNPQLARVRKEFLVGSPEEIRLGAAAVHLRTEMALLLPPLTAEALTCLAESLEQHKSQISDVEAHYLTVALCKYARLSERGREALFSQLVKLDDEQPPSWFELLERLCSKGADLLQQLTEEDFLHADEQDEAIESEHDLRTAVRGVLQLALQQALRDHAESVLFVREGTSLTIFQVLSDKSIRQVLRPPEHLTERIVNFLNANIGRGGAAVFHLGETPCTFKAERHHDERSDRIVIHLADRHQSAREKPPA